MVQRISVTKGRSPYQDPGPASCSYFTNTCSWVSQTWLLTYIQLHPNFAVLCWLGSHAYISNPASLPIILIKQIFLAWLLRLILQNWQMKITKVPCSSFLTSHSKFKNTDRAEVGIRSAGDAERWSALDQESNPNPKEKLSLGGGRGGRRREGRRGREGRRERGGEGEREREGEKGEGKREGEGGEEGTGREGREWEWIWKLVRGTDRVKTHSRKEEL